jgi:hypothetical protein
MTGGQILFLASAACVIVWGLAVYGFVRLIGG